MWLFMSLSTLYRGNWLREQLPTVPSALTLFPNCAAIGFPLLPSIFGPQASVTVVVAIAIGAITITPVTLAVLENAAVRNDGILKHLASE